MGAHKDLYVVDASVLIKWCFQKEDFANAALKLREDYAHSKVELVVPGHTFFEIVNVISLKSPGLALSFLSHLLALNVKEYYLNLSFSALALEIVKKCQGVAFYDAFYHALAISLGATFITADEKYFKKAKSFKGIMMLEDYR